GAVRPARFSVDLARDDRSSASTGRQLCPTPSSSDFATDGSIARGTCARTCPSNHLPVPRGLSRTKPSEVGAAEVVVGGPLVGDACGQEGGLGECGTHELDAQRRPADRVPGRQGEGRESRYVDRCGGTGDLVEQLGARV